MAPALCLESLQVHLQPPYSIACMNNGTDWLQLRGWVRHLSYMGPCKFTFLLCAVDRRRCFHIFGRQTRLVLLVFGSIIDIDAICYANPSPEVCMRI